jgi:hypothetical protein
MVLIRRPYCLHAHPAFESIDLYKTIAAGLPAPEIMKSLLAKDGCDMDVMAALESAVLVVHKNTHNESGS